MEGKAGFESQPREGEPRSCGSPSLKHRLYTSTRRRAEFLQRVPVMRSHQRTNIILQRALRYLRFSTAAASARPDAEHGAHKPQDECTRQGHNMPIGSAARRARHNIRL